MARLSRKTSLLRWTVAPTSFTPPPPPCREGSVVLVAAPSAMVRPAMVTVAWLPMSKTRLALLPLTVSWPAPGPVMVRSWLMTSWPLLSVMVWPERPAAKSMVSPAAAAAISPRSEPSLATPVSRLLVTVRVLGSQRPSRGSRRGRKNRGRLSVLRRPRPVSREVKARHPRSAGRNMKSILSGAATPERSRPSTEGAQGPRGGAPRVPAALRTSFAGCHGRTGRAGCRVRRAGTAHRTGASNRRDRPRGGGQWGRP